MDVARIARSIEAELKWAGTPERAVAEKAYLKSDLRFFGVRLADIRRIAKSVTPKGDLSNRDVTTLVRQLWAKPIFERRMVAVILLDLHASVLGPRDLKLIEGLIRESKTWALVDGLAGDVLGQIAMTSDIRKRLDRWAKDKDFWVRRASLLAEIEPLKKGAPFEPFAERADLMLDETEFFIRKAIGWVLREMSKKRPDEVYEWIAPRTDRASGVTMREVVKYLDPERAERLMTAYKAGRAA